MARFTLKEGVSVKDLGRGLFELAYAHYQDPVADRTEAEQAFLDANFEGDLEAVPRGAEPRDFPSGKSALGQFHYDETWEGKPILNIVVPELEGDGKLGDIAAESFGSIVIRGCGS